MTSVFPFGDDVQTLVALKYRNALAVWTAYPNTLQLQGKNPAVGHSWSNAQSIRTPSSHCGAVSQPSEFVARAPGAPGSDGKPTHIENTTTFAKFQGCSKNQARGGCGGLFRGPHSELGMRLATQGIHFGNGLRARNSSSSCFCETALGALVRGQVARWVLGYAITSRRLCEFVRSMAQRSRPKAMPP